MLGEPRGSRTALSTGQGPERLGETSCHSSQCPRWLSPGALPASAPLPTSLRECGARSPGLEQFCFLSHRAGGSATVFAFTFQRELEPPSPPPPPPPGPETEDERLGLLRGAQGEARGWGLPAALPAETQCPEGPPATSQGPALLYLWHPAVGLWAREQCRQRPGPSTPTQLGPGAVSDRSAE